MNVAVVSGTGAKVVLQPESGKKQKASAANFVHEIINELDDAWLARLYRERILNLRTRSHHLNVPAKANSVEIQHTLLGVELKAGKQRFLCPDLATARYLAVFARVGSTDVAVPYDITQISTLADELESAWHRMLLLVERVAADRSAQFRSRLRTLLVSQARREIAEAGAGTLIPKFNQNTKQRRV
ncbi:MAG: hypothetical protein ICV60_18955 [Pyrinomonadaceae bacterium]|nr:hypothetical protein [Pyrinomonadaceae bacterium]